MVQTRGQRRDRPVDYGLPRRHLPRYRKRYKPSDVARRHRLKDRQPKAQKVRTYFRRV